MPVPMALLQIPLCLLSLSLYWGRLSLYPRSLSSPPPSSPGHSACPLPSISSCSRLLHGNVLVPSLIPLSSHNLDTGDGESHWPMILPPCCIYAYGSYIYNVGPRIPIHWNHPSKIVLCYKRPYDISPCPCLTGHLRMYVLLSNYVLLESKPSHNEMWEILVNHVYCVPKLALSLHVCQVIMVLNLSLARHVGPPHKILFRINAAIPITHATHVDVV